VSCPGQPIEALLDGELDVAQSAAVERHVADCSACAQAFARLREQKAALRALPRFDAPDQLRHSIRDALRREVAPPAPAPIWRWAAIAACLCLAVSLGWNAVQWRGAEASLEEGVVASHIRSLLASHLMDVPSSDQHTVKPWFAGKLDFSPVVKDLAAQGFPLEGGRVDYLDGRRVAALVFRRAQHTINLFTWPAAAGASASHAARDGYNVLHWTHGGMAYWAVSDVSAAELARLRVLFED
jgi:anti-sigma factor RsiW